MREHQTISIDGPAASGKTCAGKLFAEKIGYQFIDSGSIYRALVWGLIGMHVEYNPSVIAPLLSLIIPKIGVCNSNVSFEGHVLTQELRDDEVNRLTPVIGSWPDTRVAVKHLQQELCHAFETVITGRDIGTEVMPNASPKFFLTATPEVRAYRRWQQLPADSRPAYEDILSEITGRDYLDQSRTVSPMRIPTGAIIVATDQLDLNQTVKKMLSYYKS